MTTQDNISTLRRFIDEMINQGNLTVIDEVLTPDFVEHEQLPPGITPGREGVKHLFTMLRAGFPDLRADIEQVVAQDDLVVLRMTWRGTHTGPVMGIPPTGKTVAWQVIDTMRVADGKVVEHWGMMDQFGLLSQLGAIPTPVAAS